ADRHQHIAKLDKLTAVADRTVAGDYYGVVRHAGQRVIHPPNHAIDATAYAVVYERIIAIPKIVAEGQHVRFFEVNRDITIGVAWTVAFELNSLAVKLKALVRIEGDGRPSAYGPRLKCIVPFFYARSGRKTLQYILVRDDRSTETVQPFIAVRVIP